MRVAELEGANLDFWVAKAEGLNPVFRKQGKYPDGSEVYHDYVQATRIGWYSPSTDWSQGGPIIEREGIKLKDGMFEKWRADLKAPYHKHSMEGPAALIAAMRAFVASRFGVQVDDC